MNQIAVGLIIGGLVGFGIGLTLAPDVVLSGISEDQQELLCLEERSQLMDEVRQALKKMETAQCAPVPPALDEPSRLPLESDASPDQKAVVALDEPGPVTVKANAAQEVNPKLETEPKIKVTPAPAKPAIKVIKKPEPKAQPTAKPTDRTKTAPAASNPASGGWMVQLVASPDPAEAGKVERKARALGLSTRVVLEEVADQSRSLYKVRVGPFTDKSGGVEALRRIKRELKITGWLHRED